MNIENVEEKYEDVLQNIEFAIVQTYRQQPQLIDFEVDQAVEALVRSYTAELLQRPPSPPRLKERPMQVYDSARAMCEWRLGRNPMETVQGQSLPVAPPPVSLEVIIACLKRIRRSIKLWTKEGGRQGYLHFVEQFLP